MSNNGSKFQRTSMDGARQVRQSEGGGKRPRALASGRRGHSHCQIWMQMYVKTALAAPLARRAQQRLPDRTISAA
jgi:hypothetical protein